MLLKEHPIKADTRRYSLADQAKALALILREEFGAPFAFYDATTGEAVWGHDSRQGDKETRRQGDKETQSSAVSSGHPVTLSPCHPVTLSPCHPVSLSASEITALAAKGRPVVTALPDGRYQLTLLLYESNKPVLVASGTVAALSQNVPAQVPSLTLRASVPHTGPKREREGTQGECDRLQKWLQAVADRLRLTDQLLSRRRLEEEQNAQITLAWEAILTLDCLIRRLRIHKSPEKNQKRILDVAFGLLGVQAVVWVPRDPDELVVSAGESGLGTFDCRQLADVLTKNPDHRPSEPLLCNRVQQTPWGVRFPRIENLLAFEVDDHGGVGWLIAVNKGAGRQADQVTGRQGDKVTGRQGGKARGSQTDKKNESDAGSSCHPVTLSPCHPVTSSSSCHPATPAPAPSRFSEASLNSLSPNHPVTFTAFRKADVALLAPLAGLMELHARGSRRYQDLKELLVGLTRSLTLALDAKDSYTFGHSERMARIAVELGRELGLSDDELSDIYLAGLLHDVGKIGVRDAVLSKPGPLTPEEFEHIKQHVTIGYKILADLRPIRNLLPGVLYHHERYDGKGYPDGLAGDNIPLLARILSVADGYDAMSTARPYRDPMPCRKVEQILAEGAATQWDKQVIDAFMRSRQKIHVIRQQGVGDSLCHAIDGALRTGDSSFLLKPTALTKSAPDPSPLPLSPAAGERGRGEGTVAEDLNTKG